MRLVLGLVITAMALQPMMAQEAESPWRAVVTGQIEAFRSGDAEAALEFAGATFKSTYSDADRFLADVERSGYGPIIESRSHSFGVFREVGETGIVQVVNLVGPDQRLYEAVYQLREEPGEGWRVQGVVLRQSEGIGI